RGGSLASSAARPLLENSDFLVNSDRAEVRFGFIGILLCRLSSCTGRHRAAAVCVGSAPSTNGRMALVNQRLRRECRVARPKRQRITAAAPAAKAAAPAAKAAARACGQVQQPPEAEAPTSCQECPAQLPVA